MATMEFFTNFQVLALLVGPLGDIQGHPVLHWEQMQLGSGVVGGVGFSSLIKTIKTTTSLVTTAIHLKTITNNAISSLYSNSLLLVHSKTVNCYKKSSLCSNHSKNPRQSTIAFQ
jgi:hypothetical protein